MSKKPQPDEHGRYRVRRKGDTSSPSWSTRIFQPDKHVIVDAPASDTYGRPWPPTPADVTTGEPAEVDNPTTHEETNHV